LFLDRYGQLINLSASGQLAMRKMFDDTSRASSGPTSRSRSGSIRSSRAAQRRQRSPSPSTRRSPLDAQSW
jgi:hypothetical protein